MGCSTHVAVVLGGAQMYKSPDMQFRPSRALARLEALVPLVACATLLAVEPSAHAQAAPKGAKGPGRSSVPAAPPGAAAEAPAAPAAAPPAAAPADDADREEKRAVYLSGELGFVHANLGAISDNLAFDKSKASGLLAGLGLGYRFKALRIGARFRDASTSEFSLWSLMGEVGFGLPFRPLTPVIFLHAGYVFDEGVERSVYASSLPSGTILEPKVHLEGLVLGAEAYAAYSVTKVFKIGPFVGFDMTFLHRPQPNPPKSAFPSADENANSALFSGSGSGVGYMINLGIRATGDIAF